MTRGDLVGPSRSHPSRSRRLRDARRRDRRRAGARGPDARIPIDPDLLVALVHHELRTPLTMMVGYSELLSCGEAGELTEEQRVMVEAVERGASRVHALVDDLLLLATRALGDGRDPRQVTTDVEQAVRRLAGLEPDPDLEPTRVSGVPA